MKRFKLIYILSPLLFLFTCNEYLEVEPDLQISINEQLSTKTGVINAHNGIYSDLEDILSSRHYVYADVQAGNITFSPNRTSKTIEIPDEIEFSYQFNDRFQDSDYSDLYETYYEIINQINILLVNSSDFTFFNESELNRLQAELLTMRAFAHYQVSLFYSQNYNFTPNASHLGIVYNKSVLVAGEDFPSRETKLITYELLKEDLDLALSLFNNNQLYAAADFSFFNPVNSRALYARIALQMNDWQKASEMSEWVINNANVNLMSTQNYISQWEEPISPISEVLLEFTAPVSSEGDVSSSISEHYNFTSTTLYSEYVASVDLLNLYTSEDIRQNLFIEENLPTIESGLETEMPYFFTKKFQDDAGTLNIRLSEMYLIKSEASFRLGNVNDALLNLNTIRTRANLSEINTSEDILEEIFLERRRELAFEGFLLFDHARFQKDINRNLGCIAIACDLSYPSNQFVLPIPASSTELNENMIQNEGY